jgi:hypothetical protein
MYLRRKGVVSDAARHYNIPLHYVIARVGPNGPKAGLIDLDAHTHMLL